MNDGYGHKLFILAFDHRGSFQKKWFGIEGEPTEEDTRRISDAKHLVFEGLLHALERAPPPTRPAPWWTSNSACRRASPARPRSAA